MDTRAFFKKVRLVEAGIVEPFVVIVSLETSDGGKPGIMTEVQRLAASLLVVEGKARLATPEEAAKFKAAEDEARQAVERIEASRHLQVTLVPESDLKPKVRSTK
jgi:hypothetical protein